MFVTLISWIIILAVVIIALTELSKAYGPFGFNSSYSINWQRPAEGFYSPSILAGTYGAAQQENTQIFFDVCP